MRRIKIRNIALYGFLLLVILGVASSVIMFYSLKNVYNTNEDLKVTKESYRIFLQLKLETEKLFVSKDIEEVHKNWLFSIERFNKSLVEVKKLPYKNYEKLDNLWGACQEDIKHIDQLLKSKKFNTKSLKGKSLLERKGELSAFDNTHSEVYTLILSLTEKIDHLIRSERSVLKEYEKLQNEANGTINKKLEQSLSSAFIFPFLLLLLAVVLIVYIVKRIKRMEDRLESTKERLRNSFIEQREMNQFLSNIMDSVPASIFWKDMNGRYLGGNKQFLNDIGHKTLEDLIGKNDYELNWGDDEAQNYIDDDKEVLKNGTSKLLFEESHTYKDGKIIYLITSKVPLRNTKNQPVGILGSYINITEKKNAQVELDKKEKMLAQQSKMAAMGEMLENIAHQWRQPLSVITTGASGIKVNKEYGNLSDAMIENALDSIINSAEYLSQTIDDFREFFKIDKDKEEFLIKESIEKSLFILTSKFRNRNIHTVLNLDDTKVYGFKNELIQVFMNLLNNSNDALEDFEGERYVFIDMFTDKDHCHIKLKDNAGGIPGNIINKIFEAYFTTKEGSKGTGIGLYMSNEIVSKHFKGSLTAQNSRFTYNNEKYTGAEFTVSLPLGDN